jgi:hypothetical protein
MQQCLVISSTPGLEKAGYSLNIAGRDRRLGRRGSIRPLVVGCSGWEPELPRVASPTRRPRWVSAFP